MNITKRIKQILKKTPRFILKGSCKKCGNCCRNITFIVGKEYLRHEKEFENLKTLDSKYNNFFISGRDEDGILLFTCRSLGDDNLCSNYALRSLYCRLYPKIMRKHIRAGAEMLEGCGYYIESNVNFEEILKNLHS